MVARGPQNGRQVFGRSKQLSPNKFFDPSTPSMRKGRDREKRKKKRRKRRMKIVATTSLPAVDCPNADHWNAARSCQKRKECCFCGHYVIASSRPPKRQPLERRTLVPIVPLQISLNCSLTLFLFNNSLHLRVLLQNISNWSCLYHVL